MKKKFNLYCGLLIAAIVFGIGVNMFETGYHLYNGGKAGIEAAKSARQCRKDTPKKSPFEELQKIYRMTPIEMMPKANYLMNDSAEYSILNLKTGEKIPIMIASGIAMPENGSNRMIVMQVIGQLSFVLIIVFLVAFIKLVISVNKGRIFEKSMETQLAWGGWAVLAMYVLGWISTLYTYFLNVQEFEFEAYTIEILQKPDIALLYSALGMLLMGQIFKIGRQMKEEQELTI